MGVVATFTGRDIHIGKRTFQIHRLDHTSEETVNDAQMTSITFRLLLEDPAVYLGTEVVQTTIVFKRIVFDVPALAGTY